MARQPKEAYDLGDAKKRDLIEREIPNDTLLVGAAMIDGVVIAVPIPVKQNAR